MQTAIDPVQNQGQGLGIAPIGHVVTVQGVTETAVNITTKLHIKMIGTGPQLKGTLTVR